MAKTLRIISSAPSQDRSVSPLQGGIPERNPLGQVDPMIDEFESFNVFDTSGMGGTAPKLQFKQESQQAAPQMPGNQSEYANSPFNQDGEPPTRSLRRIMPTAARMAATELRPWQMGEIIPESSGPMKTGIGALSALTLDDEEFAKILKKADPDIIVDRDREEGGYYVYSPKTGKAYVINKPGLSMGDVINFTSTIAATIPAGKATTMAGRAVAEASIQSGIEGSQQIAGGEFDIEEPMLSGAFSVGSDMISVWNQARRASGVRSSAASQGVDEGAANVAADISRKVTGGGSVESKASDLAGIIDADPNVVRAADELGLAESLPTRVYSRNPQYVQVEQAIANIPGTALAQSERQAMLDVAGKADDFIEQFGGTRDLASLNEGVIYEINGTLDALRGQSDVIYDNLAKVIPTRTRADTEPLRRYLVAKARDLGGADKLNTIERKILTEVRGNRRMTYGRLDDLRQDVGEQYGQQLKGNRFGDASTYRLRELYGAMSDAQGSVIESIGGQGIKEQWDVAKGLVGQRKTLEDSAAKLLGKEFNKAVIPQVRSGINKLLDGDVYQLTKTLEGLPEQYRQSAVVSAMDSIFTRGARNQPQLNMGGFSAWWKKLDRSPKAKSVLMSNMPEGAEAFLDNLALISQQYATAVGSVPKTGIVKAMGDFGSDSGFLAKVLPMIPVAGKRLTGVFEYAGPDAVKASSDLMGNHDFRRMVIRQAQGNPVRGADNAVRRSPAYSAWVETLPPDQAKRLATVGVTDYFFGEN